MLGVYDFCGHYEWTFSWLQRRGGAALLRQYWEKAIYQDSQRHAAELILKKGFAGMQEYWGHTLSQEAAGYKTSASDRVFRIDIHECPSKGFLIQNGLEQHSDYCDHCMGWIGPMLRTAGFVIDHEHNHKGQCWWEMRCHDDLEPPSARGNLAGAHDVRLLESWRQADSQTDRYCRANRPDDKLQSPRGNG